MTKLRGFPLRYDRRFKISGPFGEGEIAEFNDELTGFTENLISVFAPGIVIYGKNAYFIINEARRRGFLVESLPERVPE